MMLNPEEKERHFEQVLMHFDSIETHHAMRDAIEGDEKLNSEKMFPSKGVKSWVLLMLPIFRWFYRLMSRVSVWHFFRRRDHREYREWAQNFVKHGDRARDLEDALRVLGRDDKMDNEWRIHFLGEFMRVGVYADIPKLKEEVCENPMLLAYISYEYFQRLNPEFTEVSD